MYEYHTASIELFDKIIRKNKNILPKVISCFTDAVINDNDLASYFLFVGSDGLMNEMIESQWQN